MNTMSYSELRAKLKAALDQVVEDHDPIIVKRAKGRDAVVMSREDYDSMMETFYLLRSPVNAKRLIAASKRNGKGGKKFESASDLKNAFDL